MDQQPSQAPTSPSGPPVTGDWPARAADLIESLVAAVRDKTVRPITLVARALVFGIIVFAATVTTVTLLSIALVRLLTVYAFNGRVWASDLVVGAVFVGIGLLAWSQRTARHTGTAE
ncbi:MAG: hypothetical protein ACLQOZ_07030 [Acidimicrobiales bacterium]|jgi:hypothetical protein